MKIRYYWLVLCLIIISNAYSQEQPQFKSKVYESEDGKLYINKELPVYLHLSVSPDADAQKYRLNSQETSAYANPMYLDTEGYNTLRSPSAVDTATRKPVYPLRDIIFEVYADSYAPRSTIKFGNSSVFSQGGKKYLNGQAVIVLSATDQTSGVEDIYYSIDGKPFAIYTDTLHLQEEKEYSVKYFAVDHVGNAEDVHEAIIVFDKTSPVTQINILEDKHENTISGRSRLELISEDKGIGVSNIKYIIDEGTERTYSSPISAKYLSEGEHTITYYATDKVNNQETRKSYTFYVDKTPPTIIEELVGSSFMANGKEFTSGRTQLKLVSFDNRAGVKDAYYSVNGEEYQRYDKPFYLSMGSGNLSISTYAVDNVNNKSSGGEETSRADIPYIDLSGPTLDFGFNGPMFRTNDTIYISDKTTISLKGSDKEAGLNNLKYRVNDKKMNDYAEPFSIDKEGYNDVYYEGFDNVDNSNNNTFSVYVDNTGPEVHASYSIAAKGKQRIEGRNYDVYPSHLVVFLSATDEKVGVDRIYYSINDQSEKPYAGLISGLKPGSYQIEIRAVDKLGNDNTEKIQFAIVQ
ncbi:MAG: hypothetical protein GVY19_11370 [Bacteroidetes bacterium]|jgi:hypothetical protein|nr:hypothetical protein [Bacteroidota bacterium]